HAKPMENSISLSVEAKRLDDLGLCDIGFIKIDVEGFEQQVLAGATGTIARDRPNLLIEIEEAQSGVPLMQSIENVCRLGYDAFFLGGGQLQPISAIDPPRHGYVFNFVFLPA